MSKYMKTCNLSRGPQLEALTYLLIHTVLPELWLLPVGTRDVKSLFITEYSLSDINLQGTDLFPLKFPLYNRIFT